MINEALAIHERLRDLKKRFRHIDRMIEKLSGTSAEIVITGVGSFHTPTEDTMDILIKYRDKLLAEIEELNTNFKLLTNGN